jgi:hypothetical protein
LRSNFLINHRTPAQEGQRFGLFLRQKFVLKK